MSVAGAGPDQGFANKIDPSAWLVLPTFALLLGQALATLPWEIPAHAEWVCLAPLPLTALRRWRGAAILFLLAFTALSVGYSRHRQLLFPQFPENHLRSVMARDGTLYLEGILRHEPERLTQRTRWQVRAERIWHPTGAEEIFGEVLISVRTVRREWRYGDRVRLRLRPLPRRIAAIRAVSITPRI